MAYELETNKPKEFQDILDDFDLETRIEFSEYIAPETIVSLADKFGDDSVYWDIYDWYFK